MPKKLKFHILCSTRKACPDVKNALSQIGFRKIKDVFGKPTADIEAIIEIKNQHHLKDVLAKISKINKEKISQVTVNI